MSEISARVTNAGHLSVETLSWGDLQWLCNGRLVEGSPLTLGQCHISPGQRNPRHYHPNCDEVLFMLSGQGRHCLGDDSIDLHPGMTIHIPTGVIHHLENISAEPIHCVIAFSSGDRQTVFLE